jgi:type II secretory ATPase GspE/PulE/Tfp pilus assembly ATPase PilB-like protein
VGLRDDVRREYAGTMRPAPETSPAMRALDHYLDLAVEHGASDVHLEPDPAGFATRDVDRGGRVASLRVRLRIDGRLRDVEPPPAHLTSPLLTRIRLLARVDLSESRLPQDGRFTFTREGKRIDVRAGFMPVEGGEKVALRLLDRGGEGLTIAGLGLPTGARSAFERAIEAANGLVIVAGPTGSGKTTTLYAAIAHLSREDVSILTVEDPVERKLAGVSQVNIDEDCGRTFPVVLRAVLRQDPDILLVGEIRDPESARIACRSALTGHLVLTTLHSSDALEALVRMEEMGLPTYLVRGTVTLVVAQRLVRRLCRDCKGDRGTLPYESTLFAQSGLDVPSRIPMACGCASCEMQGYRGRIAVFEIHDVRAARGAGSTDASTTLLHHGLQKVVAGETTFEEVLAECPATRR